MRLFHTLVLDKTFSSSYAFLFLTKKIKKSNWVGGGKKETLSVAVIGLEELVPDGI